MREVGGLPSGVCAGDKAHFREPGRINRGRRKWSREAPGKSGPELDLIIGGGFHTGPRGRGAGAEGGRPLGGSGEWAMFLECQGPSGTHFFTFNLSEIGRYLCTDVT